MAKQLIKLDHEVYTEYVVKGHNLYESFSDINDAKKFRDEQIKNFPETEVILNKCETKELEIYA
jgi:hypothetical protein